MTDKITIDREDDWFVITDEETSVTTQGKSKNEALLMLADALTAYKESDEDLLSMATDIFVPDPKMPTMQGPDGDDWSPDPPNESRVKKNRELALHLAKSHKRADFSDSHFIHRISSMIHGSSYGTKPSRLAELGSKGYWGVFEKIASGTRSIDELVESGIDRGVAQEAIDELRRLGIVAEADDSELYAGYEVITTEPYLISSKNVIDWRENFNHVLVDDLDEDDLPETPEEGVFVERMGTGYGWYHDPRTYNSTPSDVLMTLEEAEEKASMPCPKCFPESEGAERFDVTDMPGGVTRYEAKDPDEEDNR